MYKVIQKVPIPMAGLMLALATLGNMLAPYGSVYRNVPGLLAAILFLLLTVKLISNPACIREGFSNPVIASVAPTFSMGLMILSTYLRPYHYSLAFGTWVLGLTMHIVLIFLFSKRYLISFSIKNVFPSWFIVYVGIVAGSVTAPVYNMVVLGQALFWFGLIANLLLLPFVLYRIFIIRQIPEAARPTLTILAAPTSLCLAGYLSVFPEKNSSMVAFLALLAMIMAVFAFAYLPKLLKLPFYPSFSSFTFPLVISAVAIKGVNGYLLSSGLNISYLGYTGALMEYWCVAIVLYVLVKYTGYLAAAGKGIIVKEMVLKAEKINV